MALLFVEASVDVVNGSLSMNVVDLPPEKILNRRSLTASELFRTKVVLKPSLM